MPACQACAAPNPDGARFCSSCGARLAQTCPACGAEASGKFCNECGTSLTAAAAPPSPPEPHPLVAPVAERRITSVLFGDLVGFTTLSESRDPEEVRELLSRYFSAARTVVERYGGIVEKFIGDAVMAVWGVPVSHEDDAERAVRAGFDLVDGVALLGEEIGAPGLAMRVGVVTGEVAATLGATGEGMVAGDAVNTAARVQAAAQPGEVWVDDETRGLTSAAVMYDAMGPHELKGKAEPLPLFVARQVVAAVGGLRRVDGLEAPFTGRDRELRLVKELFHATLEEERPRLVAVFGPAGVGKSRLGWEFDKYVDGISDDVHWHRGRCLSYGEGVAFWALAEMVRGRFGILEGDGTDVVLARMDAGLSLHIPDAEERAWLAPRIATLIGVADLVAPGTAYSRDDLFAAWRTFFERLAHSDGSVGAYFQIDDLQWADQGLLDFLDHVLEVARAPIFILTLARTELTERVPAFGTGRRATAIHLEPLPETAMAQVVDGLVVGLPSAVRAALVERSEGVPLFAVETVRGLIDRDLVIPQEGRYVLAPDAAAKVDLDNLALPTTLHTLITSRLDALPVEERRLVQNGAVLGQAFTRDGLVALITALGDDIDVDLALSSLVRKEIFAVESDPRSPERGQYRFVQALVRGVAYDTLAKRDRKVRHLAAADFLAAEPDSETIPAVIAAHYVDAHAAAGTDPDSDGIAARAIELLERAARHALELGAPSEACGHFKTALGLANDEHTTARLTEQAARATLATGVISEAITLAERSRQTYVTAGMPVDAARALALWGETQIAGGHGAEIEEPLARAFAELEHQPGAEPVVAQLALQVARAYYLAIGDPHAAIIWFDRAVERAEALEDLPLLATTLASYAGALVLVGRQRMGLGLLRVSLDLARQLDAPQTQLRPLNNLISFLATRDTVAAMGYAEEGLALVHRLSDREWGMNLIVSSVHAYWNAGEWDAALELAQALDEALEQTSVQVVLRGYIRSITEARGLPPDESSFPELVPGSRGDVVLEAATAFLAAADARSAGDLAAASMQSASAAEKFVLTSGIDDDFPVFWVRALCDAVNANDLPTANRLLKIVADAPWGHVPPLQRGLLPWMRAVVNVQAGLEAGVEADFVAATVALRAFRAPFYLARALLDHANWLRDHDRADEAEPLVSEAVQLFTRLGAEPWVERARQLQGVAVD